MEGSLSVTLSRRDALLNDLPMPGSVAATAEVAAAAALGAATVEGEAVVAVVETRNLDDDLTRLVGWFESSEEAATEQHEDAQKARDFLDGDQMDAAERAALRRRKQPDTVNNQIRPLIQSLAALEQRARLDPKAYPRTPKDEAAAEAATDALRFVADMNDFPAKASAVWEEAIVEGAAGVDVVAEQNARGEFDIRIVPVHYDRFFADPHSREPDYSDARYLGIVAWQDEDDVLAMFPGAEEVLEGAFQGPSAAKAHDDRPAYAIWADSKRRRVRTIQIYWREADGWWRATFTRGGFLAPPAPSPYLDEDGKPACRLVMQSGYVSRKNRRYGVVRDVIPLQEELNKRQQKGLHFLSVRQVIMEDGAVADEDAARRELAKPDGLIKVNPNFRFEISQTADLAQGQVALYQEAKANIAARMPTIDGAGDDPSGRAMVVAQQGSALQFSDLLSRHRDWKRRVYAAIWATIRQFWPEEKWVRVTDDENNVRFVGLNRPVTLGEELQNLARENPDAAAFQARRMGLVPNDPRLGQVIRVENVAAETDVDIVLDEAPDVINLQQEQFPIVAEMTKAGVIPGEIGMEWMLELSPLRGKQKLQDKMREWRERQAQNPGAPNAEILIGQAELLKAKVREREVEVEREVKMAELALKDRELAIEEARLNLTAQTQQQNTAIKAADVAGRFRLAEGKQALAVAEHLHDRRKDLRDQGMRFVESLTRGAQPRSPGGLATMAPLRG